MRRRRHIIYLSGSVVVLALLALAAESLYFSDFEYRYRTRMFNKTLHDKENIMEECLNSMKPILANDDHHGSVPENDLFSLAEANKITILEFLDNRLFYWSDNKFDVPDYFDDSIYYKPLVFLQNGWFLPRTVEAGNEKIAGLLRIRTDYSLSNDIIKSGFEKEFGVPENTSFSTDITASEFHVFDKSGKFLFSLLFPEKKGDSGFILAPVLFWSGLFIVLLLIVLKVVKLLKSWNRNLPVAFAFLLFSGAYLLIIFTGIPEVFSQTELFKPYIFSLGRFIPTLGHLFILSIFGIVFSGLFFRYVDFEIRKQDGFKGFLFAVLSLGVIAVLISFCHQILERINLTSNLHFQPYRILELNIYSLVGFTSVFFLFIIPVICLLKVLRSLKEFRAIILILSAIPGLILLSALNNDSRTILMLALFFLVLTGSIMFLIKQNAGIFTMTVIFSLIYGIYSLYFITVLSEERTLENIKTQAVSFSTENDPTAEHLLLDLWPLISNDSILSWMMQSGSFNVNKEDVDMITNYLQDTYFNGYWANFNFNLIVCRNDEPLRLGSGDEMYDNCFKFFDERIRRNGQRLTGTEFYFIDNQGGRSYYLGKILYKGEMDHIHGLFIELYSDVNVFQPGYSALLLDKKYHGYAGLKDYAFAKYINGEIVLRSGEFPFDKTDAEYVDKSSNYRIFKLEGFNHVLYKNGNATVIISRPVITAENVVISFAYIFAFILLLSNLMVLIIRPPVMRGMNMFNFRQKLQLAFIGILLFSFILIGVVVAYMTVTQYNTRHYDNIKEKLHSVYLELDNRLSMEKRLDSDWRNENYSSLNELLISLSNSFNTDINLYDITGKLIATSRPEIFYRDLTSRRINNMAFINLTDFTRSEYYQRESIGNLEYLSAYTSFFNSDDKVLAILNLPYFRMQSVLAAEISNLIVAVINFTLLLVLITMSLAVVISGRLTAPLTMLSKGLASVRLGKKTEHLAYRGNDEIGELVRQYNRMVDEMEESVNKLANSEREYAWREMAKQIAHEIKNPLTPMKLNVQQLLKSWKDRAPGFDEKIEHFTINQIEYIDNLSSIASAFSSFAKMPGANPVEVNLPDQIKITLELFRDAEKITFNVKWPDEKKVIVFADKEHLNGIFSNLIKNGIQSIPPEREGIINVSVEIIRDKVLITISDNGTGIPRDIQKNMFVPNFTTKSSGMGLGLSIVRKYAETANGRIWFESEADKGTSFFVELPLKYTVEKPG